jgi:hypothetical protein
MEASRQFTDAASIRKIAGDFRKALEPLGDGQQIPLGGCDRHVMMMRELRSALDWFVDAPSSKVDLPKYFAACHANGLVNEFSQKPPNCGYQVREIAGLLYQALFERKGRAAGPASARPGPLGTVRRRQLYHMRFQITFGGPLLFDGAINHACKWFVAPLFKRSQPCRQTLGSASV